jgi:hypothetical protein
MKSLANKETIVDNLLDYFNDFTISERIEIVAQLMIKWGVSFIFKEHPELIPAHQLSPEEIIEIVLIDKRQGESLGGALAHQGLIMLMWLTGVPNGKHRDRTIA